MPHSIAVWRATIDTPNGLLRLARRAVPEELPVERDDLLVEIMRRYPGLSRALAEYLLR